MKLARAPAPAFPERLRARDGDRLRGQRVRYRPHFLRGPSYENAYRSLNDKGGAPSAFVSKFSPDGSSLVYSTYLGGSGWDYAYAIAVDSSGSAYVTV